MNKFLKLNIFPYLIYIIYKLYFKTVRYIQEPYKEDIQQWIKDGKPHIYAHFHQDELVLIERRINCNVCVMTSTSTDGEMMTRLLTLLGFHCFRGSSSRGGAKALIELIRYIKDNGYSSVMAVDGPRGPIYKVKKGVITLAKQSGYPIIPVVVECSNAFVFKKSWNKALLPKPFSGVYVKFGKTLWVEKNADNETQEKIRQELEDILYSLKHN